MGYAEGYTSIYADYVITVRHVVGKAHTMRFRRKGNIPQAHID